MIHLDKEIMAGAYDLLRTTLPFKRWKLPSSDAVSFRTTNSTATRGEFYLTVETKRPVINISQRLHSNLALLIETMAHEMIHLHEDTRHRARNDVQHSWVFRRYAKQVCRRHHFNLENFL
jgi:hypothetical protein